MGGLSRGGALLVCGALAGLLHVWMLSLLPVAPLPSAAQGAAGARAPSALTVRTIAAGPALPAAAPWVAPTPSPAPAAPARPRAPPPPVSTTDTAPPQLAAAPEPGRAGATGPAGPAEGDTSAPPAAGPPAGAGAAAPPVYRTALPPSLTLVFEVQRGAALGEAQLNWRQGDGRYELRLQGSGTAALTPQWHSRGLLDEAGIAPERFAVARRGRERHAANFQRDIQEISFSGPAARWPLHPGMQDRLSWMLQLAAVMQADATLSQPGSRVSLAVVGAHGDAGLWTFTVLGSPSLEAGPDGPVPSLHLRAEAVAPWAPQVEVWLDPARYHLPLRLRLQSRRSAESTDWRLVALQGP